MAEAGGADAAQASTPGVIGDRTRPARADEGLRPDDGPNVTYLIDAPGSPWYNGYKIENSGIGFTHSTGCCS
jgi:hypothetical protein